MPYYHINWDDPQTVLCWKCGKKVNDQHNHDHDDQYEYLLKRGERASTEDPSSNLSHKIRLKVADQYEWLVDKEALTSKSKFFNKMMESVFSEAQTETINLPEDQPDLVARMVLACSYSKYPNSPQAPLAIGNSFTASVVELMQQGLIDKTRPINKPPEPRFVSVLHLQMYVLADKYTINDLEGYALGEYWKWLQREKAEAWWATVDFLESNDLTVSVGAEINKAVVKYAQDHLKAFGGKRGGDFVEQHPNLAREIVGKYPGYSLYSLESKDREVLKEWQDILARLRRGAGQVKEADQAAKNIARLEQEAQTGDDTLAPSQVRRRRGPRV